MISPCKQAPEWRPKYERGEATDGGRAVDFQEVKHEPDGPDVCLIED